MDFGLQTFFSSENTLRATWLGLLIFVIMPVGVFAQTTDLARLEYTYIPQANSENSIGRFRTFVNFPIEMKREGSYLIAGLEYRNIDFDIEDEVPFETAGIERLQLFRTTLAYTFKMKKDWRFVGKVGFEVGSNFEDSQIRSEDIRFTGSLFFIKDTSGEDVAKPSRFIIGLNYSTNAGRPFPIPLLNYYRKFKPNWSYSLGTPKTNIKHFLNKRNAIQGYLTLDGFFSNIQNNLAVPDANGGTNIANNISMTMVLGGLGYEHYFTKNLLMYVYGGHTVFNEIRLRDSDLNNLYQINNDNTFYIRSGIKFKI